MKIEDVFEKVRDSIADSCGIKKDEIRLDDTLFNDLGIDSIDFVDILFMLETEYDISLKVGAFEKDARNEMKGKLFAKDNIITPEGLEVLRKRMPEIPNEKLQPGIAVHEIANLITVHSLCNMVLLKVQEETDRTIK